MEHESEKQEKKDTERDRKRQKKPDDANYMRDYSPIAKPYRTSSQETDMIQLSNLRYKVEIKSRVLAGWWTKRYGVRAHHQHNSCR